MDRLRSRQLLARLWLGFAVGIVVLTVVPVVAVDRTSTVPPALPAALALAGSVAAVVAVAAVDRTFAATPPEDDRAALEEFRSRSFLQVAIAEAPVLLAFALTFALGHRWSAPIGGAGGLAALAIARPTTARIARIEASWRAGGHDVSILRADTGPP